MCIFCAAVPMTIAIGARFSSKQKEQHHQAILRGEVPKQIILPAGKVTIVVLASLATGSIVYHTIIFPQTGI